MNFPITFFLFIILCLDLLLGYISNEKDIKMRFFLGLIATSLCAYIEQLGTRNKAIVFLDIIGFIYFIGRCYVKSPIFLIFLIFFIPVCLVVYLYIFAYFMDKNLKKHMEEVEREREYTERRYRESLLKRELRRKEKEIKELREKELREEKNAAPSAPPLELLKN